MKPISAIWRHTKRPEVGVMVGVSVVFLALALATVPDYGPTWDAAELYAGDKYFYWWTTLDWQYLDFRANNLAVYQRNDHPTFYPYAGIVIDSAYQIWPLGPLATAVTKYIFYTRLHWLSAVDAHHLAVPLIAALALLALYGYGRRHYGVAAAGVAVLSCACHPRLWAHLHNNPKDIGNCLMYLLTIITFSAAMRRRRAGLMLLAAVVWGLALATKANALFLALILGPYFLLELWQRRQNAESLLSRPMLAAVIVFPFLGLLTMWLAWPFMWLDFPANLLLHLRYLAWRGGQGPPHFQLLPLIKLLTTTPLPMLLLAALGLIRLGHGAWRRGRLLPLELLLLLWLAVPVLRVSLPRATDFDGIRHWLEVVPALGLLAGLGALPLLTTVGAWLGKRQSTPSPATVNLLLALLVLVWFSPVIAWDVRNHPYQIAYFNPLIGGLAGAQARGIPEATDYSGSAYRQGMRWINLHAAANAMLLVGVNEDMVHRMANVWARADLVNARMLLDDTGLPRPILRQAIADHPSEVYLMYITRAEVYSEFVREIDTAYTPTYAITVDGAPILKIFLLRRPE